MHQLGLKLAIADSAAALSSAEPRRPVEATKLDSARVRPKIAPADDPPAPRVADPVNYSHPSQVGT